MDMCVCRSDQQQQTWLMDCRTWHVSLSPPSFNFLAQKAIFSHLCYTRHQYNRSSYSFVLTCQNANSHDPLMWFIVLLYKYTCEFRQMIISFCCYFGMCGTLLHLIVLPIANIMIKTEIWCTITAEHRLTPVFVWFCLSEAEKFPSH